MRNPDLLALPFHVHHTFYRVYGLLRLEHDHLALEFQSRENVLGLIRGPIRNITVPLDEIADLTLGKGLWGGRNLRLRTFRLQVLRKFPGALQGCCQLSIRRVDASLAEQLVNTVELQRAERHLRWLENPEPSVLSQEARSRIEQVQQIWSEVKGLLQK